MTNPQLPYFMVVNLYEVCSSVLIPVAAEVFECIIKFIFKCIIKQLTLGMVLSFHI